MQRRQRRAWVERALRGAPAGVIGAAVMALYMALVAANANRGILEPFQLIGATVFGTGWRSGLSAFLGAGIHAAVGALMGAIFAATVGHRAGSRPMQAVLGIVFGAVVFAPMTYLVLPVGNPVMFRAMHAGALFVAHLLFGLTTGIALGPIGHLADERAERHALRHARTV